MPLFLMTCRVILMFRMTTGNFLDPKARLFGLFLVSFFASSILTGCVTAADVGLSVATHVVGRMIPIDDYLPQIDIIPNRPNLSGRSQAYRLCYERLTEGSDAIQISDKSMDTFDWCLKSRKLTDGERYRLKAAKAIIALELNHAGLVEVTYSDRVIRPDNVSVQVRSSMGFIAAVNTQ